MKNITYTVFCFFLAAPFIALAQNGIPPGGGTPPGGGGGTSITNPLQAKSIYELLKALVDIVVQIGFYVALVAIVYSGFLFVTTQGDTTKLTNARKALTYSLVGTAVLLGAWVFAIAIQGAVDKVRQQVGIADTHTTIAIVYNNDYY